MREKLDNPVPLDHWPQQSPIRLFKDQAIFVSPGDALTIDYSGGPFSGKFEGEEGHRNFVLDPPSPRQTPPIVTLGAVRGQLIKIHLHSPSEHDLEGKNHDVEIHLIHRIERPTSGSELLVLGVLFGKRARTPSSAFFADWAAHGAARDGLKRATRRAIRLDPRQLLPKQHTWFRYEGSLTSPPYNETVSWLVFNQPLAVSSTDLKLLERDAHQPERAPQPVSRRFVLRNF